MRAVASLGIAISEAVEVAAQDPDCNYALGSVLNHVLLHQTVIGQEAIAQLELAGAGMPDVIVGCVGLVDLFNGHIGSALFFFAVGGGGVYWIYRKQKGLLGQVKAAALAMKV